MNGCGSMQARFSEYLDGRLNGRQMQEISGHLDRCRDCSEEFDSLKQVQQSLGALRPVPEPKDLLLRIRVAVSQERARSKQTLLGTVVVLVTMFTQPEAVQATTDEPLGSPTAPKLVSLSSGVSNADIGTLAGPVVVEAYVNDEGEVYDFRIVSGPDDSATRTQVQNLLLFSFFEPAKFFGRPVRGMAYISFTGVSVRG